MTEHFNTYRFHDIYDQLDRSYAYQDDYYDVDGFKVLSGMEVDVRSGGHILVIGPRHVILQLQARLEPHPFRESNSLYQHDVEILKLASCWKAGCRSLFRLRT